MKKLILTVFALVILFSAKAQQTVAICKGKYGWKRIQHYVSFNNFGNYDTPHNNFD